MTSVFNCISICYFNGTSSSLEVFDVRILVYYLRMCPYDSSRVKILAEHVFAVVRKWEKRHSKHSRFWKILFSIIFYIIKGGGRVTQERRQ